MRRIFGSVLAALLAAAALHLPAAAQADLNQLEGQVEIYEPTAQAWRRVRTPPFRVLAGDKLRTGAASSASLLLPDGSRVLLGPSSELAVPEVRSSAVEFSLSIGSLRAWVQKRMGRRFQVRTPTAVCAVRGTEFTASVTAARVTDLEVSEGVVNVKSLLGEELEVGDGRPTRFVRIYPDKPIDVQAARPAQPKGAATAAAAPKAAGRGVATVIAAPARERGTAPESADDEFKKDVQREVALGLSKEAVQSAAAEEARRAEYQEGKTLVDVNGNRVRLEEYVLRPAPDQFKLVALNSRADRFDYFYYQAQFNQNLPEDLRVALQHLGGKDGAAPDYFITSFETGRSNTIDSIQEVGTGGHLVQAPLVDDKVVYDATINDFRTIAAGTQFWETLFDNYSYRVNGAEKFGWLPAGGPNITSYDYVAGGINTRIWNGGGPMTVCATQVCEDTARPSAVTYPSGSAYHERATITYAADGSKETYDFYIIDDEGRLATSADFGGATAGERYKDTLLKFNFQQIITATEFQGRTIDLVVEPKILVKSGLIQ